MTWVRDEEAAGSDPACSAAGGEKAEDERLARLAADAGDPRAILLLAQRREADGDQAEAERLYQMVIDTGDTWAMALLARKHEQAGKHAEVERLARLAADVGDPAMLKDLALRNAHTTDWRQMLLYGLEADGSTSEPW